MPRPTTKENLPLPYVEYPYAFYGAFPGFRETPESAVVFCECQRNAIFNRIDLCCPGVRSDQLTRSGLKIPDIGDFPEAFYKPLLKAGAHTDEAIAAALQFLPKICHQRGFSVESLQGLNLRWRRSNQDWRILLKYYSLWRDQGYLLKKHGLTPELIKAWLAEPGAYKSLTQQFGIKQTMVSLILSGKSTGLKAENVIREVARRVFGNKALGQQKLAELLQAQRKLEQERGKLLRQIKSLKKKLEIK